MNFIYLKSLGPVYLVQPGASYLVRLRVGLLKGNSPTSQFRLKVISPTGRFARKRLRTLIGFADESSRLRVASPKSYFAYRSVSPPSHLVHKSVCPQVISLTVSFRPQVTFPSHCSQAGDTFSDLRQSPWSAKIARSSRYSGHKLPIYGMSDIGDFRRQLNSPWSTHEMAKCVTVLKCERSEKKLIHRQWYCWLSRSLRNLTLMLEPWYYVKNNMKHNGINDKNQKLPNATRLQRTTLQRSPSFSWIWQSIHGCLKWTDAGLEYFITHVMDVTTPENKQSKA